MAYVDLTDAFVECTEHGDTQCWDCLATHHIEETERLTRKVKDLTEELEQARKDLEDAFW